MSTYSIEWPWAQAAEAVRAWQAFAPHAPDGLFSVCDLLATDRSTPNARAHVVSGGQFFGGEQELRSLIQPLVDTGTPIRVTTATMSYMHAVLKWAGCSGSVDACHLSPRGTLGRETFKGASDYVVRPLQPQAVAMLVQRIELLQETLGRGAVLMDAYGGAINRVPKGATAFVHRNALFSCQYVASWNPGEGAGPHLSWVRGTRAAMRPYVSGFAYQNYIDPDVADWKRAYYGSNYRRLAAIKRRYDPRKRLPLRTEHPAALAPSGQAPGRRIASSRAPTSSSPISCQSSPTAETWGRPRTQGILLRRDSGR